MYNEYRTKRKEKKITTEQVSATTNISRGMISRFENNHNDISLGFFVKMVKAIGCKLIIINDGNENRTGMD